MLRRPTPTAQRLLARAAASPGVWLMVSLALGALAWAGLSHAQQQEQFTSEERARLDAGRLVMRSSARTQGQLQMIGGTSWQVVDEPIDVTWRAICDAEQYRHMFPSTSESVVVAHAPGERVVRLRHEYGPVTAQYYLRMQLDEPHHDIAFRLDRQRPSDLRAAWGFLSARPYGEGDDRTLISWGIMADVGGGMLGGLFRGQIHENMLRVPATIRGYLQGAGRGRY